MTPRLAVADSLAQLVAQLSHSRLFHRKWSSVVPLCIITNIIIVINIISIIIVIIIIIITCA